MEDHNLEVAALPKNSNRFIRGLKSFFKKIVHKPIYLFAIVFGLIGVGVMTYTLAASESITGRLDSKHPVGLHSVQIAADGQLKATLKDNGRRWSDSVRYKLRLLDSSKNELVSYKATRKGEPVKITYEVSPGKYYLEVSAGDSLTRRGTRYNIDVEYPDPVAPAPTDTEAPSVSINNPAEGESLQGEATISGQASDNVSVSSVEYRFAGDSWQVATGTTNWTGLVDTTSRKNGAATIEVRAVDSSGNKISTTRGVTINNTTETTPNDGEGSGSGSGSGDTGGGSSSGGGTGTDTSSADCGTTKVWQSLESCGWPGASNTGPSGSLVSYPNGLSINSPGVYSNLDVKGYLNINASNVTIRNFKLSEINPGYTAMRVDPSVTNVVIEDCEINPNFVTQFAIWGYDGITVRRCEIYRNGGAIQARQDLVFEDNYCHDIDDVANDGDDWHTNCVIAVNDSRGVSNWRIYHNSMRLGTPGGLKYLSGVINTLLAANNNIEKNLIANGAYSMYLFDTRSANVTPTNTTVKDNRFSVVDSSKVGIYGIWYPGQGWSSYSNHVTFSGNKVLETGVEVNGVEP
ncbi:right-handed parallel beta-helix repeat-containing protein [Candidatus Saccharibacteria bacterium]|nr:right-handed parallel beta-helix repeat-containing protein [Candidatus Saccharibacteria bacterium]